ncbi:phage replication protein O [Erwinia phage phiEt88]|uniref:replication initiation O-like n=1 Tax=Erwinia phage phiEt88 TaxID=925984 RepID=UPI0001F1FC82|nr:replication initiation O-like [Erwinia phage phiEt88]CBX44561.1 phage replication protein O [Erwinia phage phiEt88]
MSVVEKLSDYRPKPKGMERRVADTDDGFIMLAMELYEELIGANLTKNQQKIAHAVCRKTYGFKKKMDRIADIQLASLCRISRSKANIAKNQLIEMGVLLKSKGQIGPNKNISEWKIPDCSQFDNFVTKEVTNNVTKLVTQRVTKTVHTKDTSQNIKENTPLTPLGGMESLAQECLDYYNEITNSRCSATTCFEKALNTVKAKGICYTADEVKLVTLWAASVWGHKPSINNICRMTRFDNYLSSALKWNEGTDRNPEPCPHEKLIALWNQKFPERAVELHEWNKYRPAYKGLERIWNAKTSQGAWREDKHIDTIFNLIRKSTLVDGIHEKYWLTLDWILDNRNWAKVYEQVRREYKAARQEAGQ